MIKINNKFNDYTVPSIVSDIVALFKKRYPQINESVILNMFIAKLAHMFTSKRICYKECNLIGIPNHYSLIFMPSGYGKDKMSNEMDKLLFNKFRIWFEDKANGYRKEKEKNINDRASTISPKAKQNKFIEDEISKIRDLGFEIHEATPEGIFADAKAIQDAGIGSLMFKRSEFGLMLKNKKQSDQFMLPVLFELYDGKITSKSIKGENRCNDIINIPCSILFFSDPTLFAKDLKEMFNTLMQTGLGRRATISYMQGCKLLIDEDPNKAYKELEQFVKNTKIIEDNLFNIFTKVNLLSEYVLTESTYKKVLYKYKQSIYNRANALDDNDLLKKEIISRELKAIKLSCLFAVLNHPTILEINEIDMKQAIDVVEYLGQDFRQFIQIRPKTADLYERVFEFFKENLGAEFLSTFLKRQYYKEFFCKRKYFNDHFDEIMNYVSEIATDSGFLLSKIEIKPTGTKYVLTKQPINNDLNEEIVPLEMLI